jgi:hypothetical protein
MRIRMMFGLTLVIAAFAPLFSIAGQTPVPFPRPGQQPAAPPASAPATPAPRSTQPATPSPAGEPNETTLGVPIYPSAQFIASYDAGQGQRYYLFGSETDFVQIVTYYKSMLKQKGDLVFEEPPVHMFDIGRFKEETMAFPPSVTVKDYAWGGSQGYLNPKRGATPARYKTIIQIVPVLPGAPK